MVQVEDKPSLDAIMAHYGKMGMHWGHRNGTQTANTPKPKKVKVTTADINAARSRQEANINKMNNASDNHALARTAKGKAATQKVVDKHWDAYLKDMKVAEKTTRGEKVTIGVLAVIGVVGIAASLR